MAQSRRNSRASEEEKEVKKIERELTSLKVDVPPVRIIFNRRYESDAS